ncbi:hypothetical protein BS78_09G216700 [Paspalum vaginatum]|nr:hypothetical protein BS78_09G216700 [Paspalum vaginatum]
MDSTAADDLRQAKRPRLTPSPGDDVDMISGLDDDVLLRILRVVADARDAVRTSALSRRWLGLWTRVPALRFAFRPVSGTAAASVTERCAALKAYASVVSDVLAQRRTRSDCARLIISYTTGLMLMNAEDVERLSLASAHATQGWMQYAGAFRQGLKSFTVDMNLPHRRLIDIIDSDSDSEEEEDRHSGEEEPVVLLDKLPSCLETIHLALGDARLRLPTAMRFMSLIDLSLERIGIENHGALHLLAHLVSSVCCPHLQKLRMDKIWFPNTMEEEIMQLEADELSELWVENVHVQTWELKTPMLRSFHIDKCHGNAELRISAPRLEEFEFFQRASSPKRLEVNDELSCVRNLKIGHGFFTNPDKIENDINANILLLKQCSSATCLDVTLGGIDVMMDPGVIQSWVPQLHSITSLTVNIFQHTFRHHDYRASVASLLCRFNNLTSLSLHLHSMDIKLSNNLERHHQDDWALRDTTIAHLLELELTGLRGTDCELWFMKAVIASAKRLHKVAISFHPKCWEHQDNMDAFERMLLDEGMWISYRDTFTLNTCKTCKM